MYDCWVERDRLRIVMSSIMRRRRGLIVAIGNSCREGGGCDDPHLLRQETLDQLLSSSGARRYSRAARSFNAQPLLLGAVEADPRDRRGTHHQRDSGDLPQGRAVASHAFSAVRNRHSTTTEHMPSAHRRYAKWTPARMMIEAAKVGPATVALFEAIMNDKAFASE